MEYYSFIMILGPDPLFAIKASLTPVSFGKTIFLDTLKDKVNPYDHDLCDMIIGVSNQQKDTEGLLKKLKTNALTSIDLVKKKFPKFDIYNPLSYDLEKFLIEFIILCNVVDPERPVA